MYEYFKVQHDHCTRCIDHLVIKIFGLLHISSLPLGNIWYWPQSAIVVGVNWCCCMVIWTSTRCMTSWGS